MIKICRQAAVALLFSLFVFASASRAEIPANQARELDAYIKKTMQDWQVPGLAVALVKGDQVVYLKGYGVRELGKNQAVDENTIFPIGSASKAFTSTAIGMLVQDKKLSWDDRVSDRLPGFQLYDPWVTREIRMRDLLANRSGLSGASEELWYATDHDRNEIVRRLRFVPPEASFRSQYAYRNCMFLTAGQVIPAVTGLSWDAFLKERIFSPLGMSRSSTSVEDLRNLDNLATPHVRIDGRITPVPFRNIDNIGPAGSVNASIRDMSRWLRFHLNKGELDGKRIAAAAVIEETHKPHTPIPLSPQMKGRLPWVKRADYCLSWVLLDSDRGPIVYHNGQIDGIYAVVGFIPERQIGAVVLTNFENQQLSDVLFLRALDVLMERTPQDWNRLYLENRTKKEAEDEQAKKEWEASRVRGTKPSRPLDAYAGTYENEMYGQVRVFREGDRLVLRMSSHLVGDLTHWHYDTFQAVNRDRISEARIGATFVTFGMDGRGTVADMTVNDLLTFKLLPHAGSGATK